MTAEPVSAFLRGCAFAPHADAPYPRANLDDRRLPADIAAAARVPATVSLAVSGPATAIELSYTAAAAAGGMRGPSYGTAFAAYPAGGDRPSAEVPARPGTGTVRLTLGPGPSVVYLPEGMAPTLTGITGLGGAIAPGPPQRRWLAYGDSITEGWGASAPGRTWLATAARRLDLEAVNFGYAGSGRGELRRRGGDGRRPGRRHHGRVRHQLLGHDRVQRGAARGDGPRVRRLGPRRPSAHADRRGLPHRPPRRRDHAEPARRDPGAAARGLRAGRARPGRRPTRGSRWCAAARSSARASSPTASTPTTPATPRWPRPWAPRLAPLFSRPGRARARRRRPGPPAAQAPRPAPRWRSRRPRP